MYFQQLMHLSMLRPRGGGFDMATILDNEEGLEITLVSKAFPSPSYEGKTLGTRLPENNSAILENTQKEFEWTSHVRERWLNERWVVHTSHSYCVQQSLKGIILATLTHPFWPIRWWGIWLTFSGKCQNPHPMPDRTPPPPPSHPWGLTLIGA